MRHVWAVYLATLCVCDFCLADFSQFACEGWNTCCTCPGDVENDTDAAACMHFDRERCCSFYNPDYWRLSALPCWVDADGTKRFAEVTVGRKTWMFKQGHTALHQQAPKWRTGDSQARVLWPSSYALAAWLHDHPPANLATSRVIELGSGLGFPSLMAAHLGAKEVVAVDIDPIAVRLARWAARRNLAPHKRDTFKAAMLDFRKQLETRAWGLFDVILIAGQFHWKPLVTPLLGALHFLCGENCTVYMAFWGAWRDKSWVLQEGTPAVEDPFADDDSNGVRIIPWQVAAFQDLEVNGFERDVISECSDHGYLPRTDLEQMGYACVSLKRPSLTSAFKFVATRDLH
eukprot:TRINITY_DN41180_c0_g1_i1.p1 TRINITY_DN41180_c0_g1~~TRINITY_DN41180_c0_g1_i1.p1  ORF type:complete len:345 (-),score=20.76 TRINITY_DN41180_c0_g1_i1:22-1056(-)